GAGLDADRRRRRRATARLDHGHRRLAHRLVAGCFRRDLEKSLAGRARVGAGAEWPHAIRDGAPATAGLLRARGRRVGRDHLGAGQRRRTARMKHYLVLFLVTLPALALARPQDGSTAKLDHVVATVDGRPIFHSEIDEIFERNKIDKPTFDQTQAAIDALIDNALIENAAVRLHV